MKKMLPIVLCLLVNACGNVSSHTASKPAIPDAGTYIGGILLEGQTTISEFNSATTIKHSAFLEFIKFPDASIPTNSEYLKLFNFINNCNAVKAIPVITLEFFDGLESYTTAQIRIFAKLLYDLDIPVILRWGHEMNGSWYPWGQKPTLYISKFQEFADIIHSNAPNVAIAWTPNQGWGYPWPGGAYSIATTDPDFPILDTNHDGVLNELDDPYTPYYPGDTYVDWVGHSYYHWSNISERGYNQVPYDGQWGQANGIGNAIPNFHQLFAVDHNKPMMVAETSAFYDPNDTKGGGAGEADIKEGWIKEVYNLTDQNNPKLNESFPKIKLIFWFSQYKYEQEVDGNVDWRLTDNQNVIDYYKQIVADSYFIKAE